MSKYFLLAINKEEGQVSLCEQNGDILGSIHWKESRATSEEIFAALAQLLEKEGITYKEVPQLRLALDLPPHATARRIAETIERTYNTFVPKV